MMYDVLLQPEALDELVRMSPRDGQRLLKRIQFLGRNLDEMEHEALHGPLAGGFKLRAGDYRIAYDFARAERILRILDVGHRSDIYKRGIDWR